MPNVFGCAMAPSAWDCAEMAEEVKAALQNDSVAQVQALEVKFNRALKEAAEEDYLHECAIPEEVGGFKRQIFGDAAHLGAQEVVKWLADTAGLLPNTYKDLTAVDPDMRNLVCAHAAHSPLHYAVRGTQIGMVRLLLDMNANIDVTDRKGRTPLTLFLTDRCNRCEPFGESDIGPASASRMFLQHLPVDVDLAVMCLLLHRGASLRTNVTDRPLETRLERKLQEAGIVADMPGLSPSLSAYLRNPPRDYPGISRCPSLGARATRQAFTMTWRLAIRQHDPDKPGLAQLPLELVKSIAWTIGPMLNEPTPYEISNDMQIQILLRACGRSAPSDRRLPQPAPTLAPTPAPTVSPEWRPKVGATVRLHNLSKASLNGLVGTAVSWHEDKGRFGVRIEGYEGQPHGLLAVKPGNLASLDPFKL